MLCFSLETHSVQEIVPERTFAKHLAVKTTTVNLDEIPVTTQWNIVQFDWQPRSFIIPRFKEDNLIESTGAKELELGFPEDPTEGGVSAEASPAKAVKVDKFGFETFVSPSAAGDGYLDIAEDETESHPGVQLRHAASNNDIETIETILNQHENVDALVNGRDQTRELPPLFVAILANSFEAVDCLVSFGADLSIRSSTYQYSVLHVAAVAANYQMLQYLRQSRCHVMCRDVNGFTPLHIACFYGNLDAIEHFLMRDASPADAENDKRWNAIHVAVYAQQASALIALSTHCAKTLWNQADKVGRGPVHLAAQSGNLDIVQFLVEAVGCSTTTKDMHGWEPIVLAEFEDHQIVMDYLSKAEKKMMALAKEYDLSSGKHVVVLHQDCNVC